MVSKMIKQTLVYMLLAFGSLVLFADDVDLIPESVGKGAGGIDQDGESIPWSPGVEANGFVFPNGDIWSGPVIGGHEQNGIKVWYQDGPGQLFPADGYGTPSFGASGVGGENWFGGGGVSIRNFTDMQQNFFDSADFGKTMRNQIKESLRPDLRIDPEDFSLPDQILNEFPSFDAPAYDPLGVSNQSNVRSNIQGQQTSFADAIKIKPVFDSGRDIRTPNLEDPLGFSSDQEIRNAGDEPPEEEDVTLDEKKENEPTVDKNILDKDHYNWPKTEVDFLEQEATVERLPSSSVLDQKLSQKVSRAQQLHSTIHEAQDKTSELLLKIKDTDALDESEKYVATTYTQTSEDLLELSKITLEEGDVDSAERLFDNAESFYKGAASILVHGVVGSLPIAGNLIDIAEALSGQDLVSGEKLSTAERVVTVMALVWGSGAMMRAALKHGKQVVKQGGRLAERVRRLGPLPGSKSLPNPRLKRQAQGKHIPGSPNYKESNSIWDSARKDPQEAIHEKLGTGQKQYTKKGEWNQKEVVDFDEDIGFYVNAETLERVPTNKAKIHYSKNGSHIVPMHPSSN